MDYTQYIVRNPGVCGGEPVLKGTRVTVRTVLACLAEGATVRQIMTSFPTLREGYVEAVMANTAPPPNAASERRTA